MISNCEYRKLCGGCSGCVEEYAKVLADKQSQVEKLLGKFGNVDKIIGMDKPYYYRHKVHAVFGRDKKGNVISGIYSEGTHKIIPVKKCLIEDEDSRKIINVVEQLIKEFKLPIYNEDTRKGLIRHCVVRKSYTTKEIMVVLVTSAMPFAGRKNFVQELIKRATNITTIVQSINDKQTTFVMGTEEKVLYGKGFITDSLCGCKFRLSPQSFYQINPVQTEVMYKLAIEYAGLDELKKDSVALDTYCGIGTIGIIGAKSAPQVSFVGAELNKTAVGDAKRNARENEVANINFVNKDATRFMQEMAKQKQRVDVVFMDPPRSGSTKEFMDAVKMLSPKRVVYISCGLESLARDLEYFKKCGYEVKKMSPVDNFCWTGHVETCVLITRDKKGQNKR